MAVTKPQAKGKAKAKSKPVNKKIAKETNAKKTGAVPKGFKIDENERYTGTVTRWMRSRGFGFVKLSKEISGVGEVMAYWKEIQSDDRWPCLQKDMTVEFGLKQQRNELRAKEISLPGGEPIAVQESREDNFEYVGGDKNMRFLGNVKFFDFSKGFGYVKLQEGYDIPKDVPPEFRINRDEINADGAVRLGKDMEIEFGITKNKKGVYGAFNVTLPGGEAVSRAVVEGRELVGNKTFEGEVTLWSFQGGWGWIKPDNPGALPAAAKKAIKEDHEKRAKKAEKKGKKEVSTEAIYFRRGDMKTGGRVSKGNKVSFKVYTDKQGVGACEVELKA